jgi:hypothetical protein
MTIATVSSAGTDGIEEYLQRTDFSFDGATWESNPASDGLRRLTGFEDHPLDRECSGAVLALLAFGSGSATVCATVRGLAEWQFWQCIKA